MTTDWRLKIATAPAEEPLTATEAKLHLRVDFSTDDTLIERLIVAARQYVETRSRRALVSQTWDLYLDYGFPYGHYVTRESDLYWNNRIRIPLPPLASVTHVKYYDTTGTEQTWGASNYQVVTGSPGYVSLAPGATWPATQERDEAVNIRFVAGYGGASAVPAAAKAAMLLLIGNWYENREATIAGTIISEVPMAVDNLIDAIEWGSY